MTEIEKLYENVGVKPLCQIPDGYCGLKNVYEDFTAEKQIELTQKIWELRPNIYPNFDLLVDHSYGEMIATFVNNRWHRLTEQEKEQIRNILKG